MPFSATIRAMAIRRSVGWKSCQPKSPARKPLCSLPAEPWPIWSRCWPMRNRGGEVLLDERSPVVDSELGAVPRLAGLFPVVYPADQRQAGRSRRARAHPSRDDAEAYRHCAYLRRDDT